MKFRGGYCFSARGGGRTGFSRDAGGGRIIVSGARGMDRRSFSGISRAGRRTKVSAGAARDDCIEVTQRISPARSRVTDSSGSRAERAQPMKESRKRSFPRPRGGQDAFRGKAFGGRAVFPSQVLRHGGGSFHPSAKRVLPAFGAQPEAAPLPPRSARHAGGGFPGFAAPTTWDRSARLPELSVTQLRAGAILCVTTIQPSRATLAETFAFRPARVLFNRFSKNNPRALLEIKNNRFPLHKHPVSTYPLLILTAFPRPFPFRETSAVSRPDLLPQSGRAGVLPVGGSAPSGRAFRIPFPSSGKVSPARGAHNKQLSIAKNQK